MLERRGVDGYYCSRSRIRAALLRDRSALLRVTSGYFGLLRVTSGYFALLCKKQQRNYHTASQQSSPHSCESKTCYLPLLGLLHGRVLTGNCTLVYV